MNAQHIRYIDYPKYFSWSKHERQWKPRGKYKVMNSGKNELDFTSPPHDVVGRMYNASPREGKRYFLRSFLLHRPGITSFTDMANVDGIQFSSYHETCWAMGLLADDMEWIISL